MQVQECFPGMLGGITLSLVVVCLLMLVFVSSMLYNQVRILRALLSRRVTSFCKRKIHQQD